MKSLQTIGVIAASIFAISIFFSPVQAEISLSGDLEIDTSYTSTSDETTDPSTDTTIYDLGGRIKIIPFARKEAGNLFMEAKVEIKANTDGTATTDDAWGKIGTSTFDVQIGRYEAWDLHDKSNDMLIVDAPTGVGRYEANIARGRTGQPGQLALHVLPSDAFGLELGFVYGQNEADTTFDTDGDGTDDETKINAVGVRPVILSKFGPVEIAVGGEMLSITAQDDDVENDYSVTGFGARVKATFGIATLGINYASGTIGESNNAGVDLDDQTTNTMSGYCDLALGKGVLTLAGFFTNLEVDGSDYDQTHNQYFIAYAHPLPVDGAAIKFAVSQATATQETAGADIESDALAFKIRLNYDF